MMQSNASLGIPFAVVRSATIVAFVRIARVPIVPLVAQRRTPNGSLARAHHILRNRTSPLGR